MRYLGHGIGHKNQTKPPISGNREGHPLTCASGSAMGNRRQTLLSLRARLKADALADAQNEHDSDQDSEQDGSDTGSETEEEDEEDACF